MTRRLVFMGSDAIALPALDWLWEGGRAIAELVAVYTQPDRPHGRGQRLAPNAIKTWALARALPVFQPGKLTPAAHAEFALLKPDTALVMAYGHILRQEWIDTPPCSIWNLHASLLPKFRGASPVVGAIAAGETQSGVCLMRMVRALDAGPVLDCEPVALDERETCATLETKLALCSVPLLARNLARMFDARPAVVEQDHAAATFTRRLTKADGALDFDAPASVLARRINALFPWPGAHFELGGESIRIGLATGSEGNVTDATPGTVIAAAPDALVVAAGEGTSLSVLRLQRPGGRMLPAGEFLRGRPIPPGTVIPGAAMPELVSARPFKG